MHLLVRPLGDQVQTLCCQKRVTKLETEWLKLDEACAVLASLPELADVCLSFSHSSDEERRTTDSRLYLPALRKMHVKCHRLSPGELLDCLLAPQLEELYLENFSLPTSFWLSLRSFIASGSGSQLQKLKLHISDGPFNRMHANMLLLDVLRGAPQLKHLSCSGSFFNTEILKALVWNGHTPERTLVPRLQTLQIWVCRDFDVVQLIAVIRSRRHVLKDVELKNCKRADYENLELLRSAVKDMPGISTLQ